MTASCVFAVLGGRGHSFLFFFPGMLVGSFHAARAAGTCTERWTSGAAAAWVVLRDAPVAGRTATGRVVASRSGCGGDISMVFADGEFSAGSLIIVVGEARRGRLRVSRARLVRAGFSLRYALRGRIENRVRRLYGSRAGLVSAMVLGQRGGIDDTVREEFVSAGLAHLLAISGLHVGIVALWIYLLAGFPVFSRHRAGLVVGGTWAYVTLLVFPASAVRAAAFVTVGALSTKLQRTPPASVVLAIAAAVVFTIDPGAIQSVGAWLSIAAVWGTSAAAAGLKRLDVSNPLVRLLGSSLGATVMTAPITALVFGSVAPAGIISNLVAVPLAGVLVPAVFASLLLGSVMATGTGVLLWALERTAHFGASLPFGHWQGSGPFFVGPWLALCVLSVWAFRGTPTLPRIRLRVARGLAILVTVAITPASINVGGRKAGLTVYVIDVGQGDAIAVRTPAGGWVLMDAGPAFGDFDAGRRIVAPFLASHGAHSLALALVSHGDADHLGGIPSVLEEMTVATVMDPGQPMKSQLFSRYLGKASRPQTSWIAGRAGDSFEVDSVMFQVVHPSADWMHSRLEPNENSLVVLVTYRGFRMLLTGDAGLQAESLFVPALPPVDVLKVGHHGSESSTSDELLNKLRPQAAVISVGKGNSYGHPAPSVMGALADAGVDVFRTDLGGTVTIWSNGDYFDIRQETKTSFTQRVRCLLRISSRSSVSSSSRNACTSMQPANSRTYYTMSR